MNLNSLQNWFRKDAPMFEFRSYSPDFPFNEGALVARYRKRNSWVERVWSDEDDDPVLKAGDDDKNSDYGLEFGFVDERNSPATIIRHCYDDELF